MNNTTPSEAVNRAGEGAGTPSPVVTGTPCNVNFLYSEDVTRLQGLWLPCERKERAALDYMDARTLKRCGKPGYEHEHRARMALEYEWWETVKQITHRGGLLLIGGRA